MPEQPRAVRDRGEHRGPARHLGAVRAREQGRHRGGRDGLRLRDLAQDGDEALVAGEAAEDEVGADDGGRGGIGSGSAWGGRCRGGRGRRRRRRRRAARRLDRRGRRAPWATVPATGTASRARRRTAAARPRTGDATGAAGVPRGPEVGEQAAPARATATRRATMAVVRMAVLTVLVLGAGSEASPASTRRVSGASPAGNDRVTGRVSAKTSPPPGRARARSVPPSSAACSAAIARPRPGAAGRPRRVGLVEALEEVGEAHRRDARARGRRRRSPRPRASRWSATSTGAPGAWSRALSRRLPRIRSRRRGSVSTTSGVGGSDTAASGRRAATTPVTTRPRSTGSDGELLRGGVEAGHLHEVVDERPEPADVGDEQLRRHGGRRAAGCPGPASMQRRLRDERGERRPQLVRDVGDEPPVLLLGGLEARDRRLERVGHPVELGGPAARTRRARRSGTRAERSPAAIRRAARPAAATGPQDPAGDEPGDQQRDADRRPRRRPGARAGAGRAPPRRGPPGTTK